MLRQQLVDRRRTWSGRSPANPMNTNEIRHQDHSRLFPHAAETAWPPTAMRRADHQRHQQQAAPAPSPGRTTCSASCAPRPTSRRLAGTGTSHISSRLSFSSANTRGGADQQQHAGDHRRHHAAVPGRGWRRPTSSWIVVRAFLAAQACAIQVAAARRLAPRHAPIHGAGHRDHHHQHRRHRKQHIEGQRSALAGWRAARARPCRIRETGFSSGSSFARRT
jgi:hypothetical protein